MPDVPLVWADADRVVQVLVNLLDNAIKYSRPGGVVTVNVLQGRCTNWCSCRCAIRAAASRRTRLPRIGERFYRADKARARRQGGSGLGLAIAQALVEAHGGKLWLESVEGEGTTAQFTLPAV